MDDKEIVTLFLVRSESALAEVSQKYGRQIRALSYSITGDRGVAEECENETYLSAWNAIPPHDPGEYLFAFLAKITRHLSLNALRGQKAQKRNAPVYALTAELEDVLPAPDDCACRIDDLAFQQMLNGFLFGLSETERNIFLRRYWYMDSIATIATRFGFSESKVKTGLFRTREKLRAHLTKEGYTL